MIGGLRILPAAVCALALLAVPANAQQQSWGAIAYSPSTGATGWSYDAVNEVDAELRALGFCDENADDCESVITFREACGAVARGANGGWGADWGIDGEIAQELALAQCAQHDDGCRVIRWQCSYR